MSNFLGSLHNAEPYAVLKDTTVTFYYDNKRKERNGTICVGDASGSKQLFIPFNYGYSKYVNTVIFDSSFANFYPNNLKNLFNSYEYLTNIVDIKNLRTDEVTDMSNMFLNCTSLKSLDLSSFNTSNVTNMSDMFRWCFSLTDLDLSGFNTTNVTTMYDMFNGCKSLKSLNLSSFNPVNVNDMGNMFYRCDSLTILNLNNFNTASVTSMGSMFAGCSSLMSLDLSSFNTSNVKCMDGMFAGCSSLTNLDVSHFNTSNVTSMGSMFAGCSSLTSLDLSNFNTSNLTEAYGSFFKSCGSLCKIYVSSNWKSVGIWWDNEYMFYECNNLVGGQGTKIGKNFYGYNNNGNPLYYECGYGFDAAHIDGGKDNPGLFTAK